MKGDDAARAASMLFSVTGWMLMSRLRTEDLYQQFAVPRFELVFFNTSRLHSGP
jgi:hypothetical protein